MTKPLADARRLVGHFHHSPKSTEALEEKQCALGTVGKGTSPLHVIQDVLTHWHSSFLMLQQLVQLRLPIMAVLEQSSHRHLLLKDTQWNLAKQLVQTLEGPAKVTTVLGGERYCNQSFYC